MLELQLRSGQVVAFDGRVVEVFTAGETSRRLHISQLANPQLLVAADGVRTLALEDGTVTLAFAREEAPMCARLIATLADAGRLTSN